MTNSLKKAVFLDRDGTIIIDRIYLNDPKGIEVFKESYPALHLLYENGYMIILVTNQSGVARGIVKEENVKIINDLIIEDFAKKNTIITGAYYCPHPVDGGCQCRKPNPGMLIQASKEHSIDLKLSWMVGDRMTDVEAGIRAGCKPILLQNETTHPPDKAFAHPEVICHDVLDAAKHIIKVDSK